MPKVSVIIPVYNVEPYLRECLDSIANQTLQDIEIICVNDGSTDASLAILEEYKRSDTRINILSQENKGQSAARNVGLQIVSGEYLYFMDSDDILELNALELLYQEAKKDNLDIVYFDADVFFESEEVKKQNSNYLTYYDRKKTYPDVYNGLELLKEMEQCGDYRPSPCLQLIRTMFMKKNRIIFFEGIIHEDNLFSLQCILQADRVKHMANVLFHRRIRKASTMTQKKSAKNVQGYFICFVESVKFCLSNNLEDPIIRKKVISFYKNAATIYKELTQQEKKSVIWKQGSFEEFMFRILIKDNAQMQFGEIEDASMAVVALQNQLNSVYQSKSYRLGKILTFIPKKIRGGILCYQEHGMQYTVQRLKEQIKERNIIK